MNFKLFLRLTVSISCLASLIGCATGPTPEQLSSADYGPPPPENYREMIKSEFDLKLIDGASARYKFYDPDQGYTSDAPMYGTKLTFGWHVCGIVNAKNRMGGYTGWSPFYVIFRHNSIYFSLLGTTKLDQAVIKRACAR